MSTVRCWFCVVVCNFIEDDWRKKESEKELRHDHSVLQSASDLAQALSERGPRAVFGRTDDAAGP